MVPLAIALGVGSIGLGMAQATKKPQAMPTPKPVAPPVTPKPVPTSPEDIEKLRKEEEKKIRKGRPKRTTLLTGPRGVLTPPEVQRKTLLGE